MYSARHTGEQHLKIQISAPLSKPLHLCPNLIWDFHFLMFNEHNWLKKRDCPAVRNVMFHPGRNLDLIGRKYKEREEHGRLSHHWLAAKAQTHTHTLAFVGVESIEFNLQALTTRDNKGETPIDIAHRSGACAEIIGLLS